MIVLKFGGTSVADAARVREAAAISVLQPVPRVIVVSAAAGITNLLLDAARAAGNGQAERAAEIVTAIRARHEEIAAGIEDEAERAAALFELDQLHAALDHSLVDVLAASELTPQASDQIVATGEKCLSVLMAASLRAGGTAAAHVFADRILATDGRHGGARPDRARTRERANALIRPLLEQGLTVVVTGFIGFAPTGATTTLGRGGSDYSATLLGGALDADEVQIWTDVPGVLSADPRQVPEARVVSQISYDEAQELAHFGAKVLHPRTIRPAVAAKIPVRILSTFAPRQPGTLVSPLSTGQHVKAITALRGLILLTLDVPEMEDLAAAAAATFRVLHEERVEIAFVQQASSRRRMTYLIDTLSGGCARIQQRLASALTDLDARVNCLEEVAMIAAVGQGAASQSKALARMLDVLTRAAVPVLATSQQQSNVAMLAAVPGSEADRAVSALHESLIGPIPVHSRARRPRRTSLLAEPLRVG